MQTDNYCISFRPVKKQQQQRDSHIYLRSIVRIFGMKLKIIIYLTSLFTLLYHK